MNFIGVGNNKINVNCRSLVVIMAEKVKKIVIAYIRAYLLMKLAVSIYNFSHDD